MRKSLLVLGMIGLGGGAFATLVQARLPEVYIDAVKIDQVVAQDRLC